MSCGRTLDEIRRLDAGSWFSPEFAGEPVPTLEEVLDLVDAVLLTDLGVHLFGQRALGTEMRDLYGRLIDGTLGVRGRLRSGGDAEANRLKAAM